jgi:hypothetical protein
LPDGPGGFPRDFSCPAVLRYLPSEPESFSSTGLSPSAVPLSRGLRLTIRLMTRRPCGPAGPTTPESMLPGLGCSAFARRYWRNHCCFLFLQVLRWFTSLSCLPAPMDSAQDAPVLPEAGFPIRKSPGQSLFAAHRGLSQLTASFVDCWRQGIHRTPLVA